MQVFENGKIGRDETGLEAVAASEILRHYDRNRPAVILDEQDLRVIGSEIAVLHSLSDERPKDKSLIGSLEIQHNIEREDKLLLFDEENSPEELLRDRERSYPHLSRAGLIENPSQDVSHLQNIAHISLIRVRTERAEHRIDESRMFHRWIEVILQQSCSRHLSLKSSGRVNDSGVELLDTYCSLLRWRLGILAEQEIECFDLILPGST